MFIDLVETQKMLEWIKTKLYLNTRTASAGRRSVRRGQVYRCNFGCGVGSEMQKERPAIIIQNDIANRNSGNTIVIPITHDTSTLPCMVPITTQYDASGNIILDGKANTSNIMCVSKARLGDLVCTLSNADMKKVDESLAKSVDLMTYYSDITTKLNDKLNYLATVKQDRNKAQDKLKGIKELLTTQTDDNGKEILTEIAKIIDSEQ